MSSLGVRGTHLDEVQLGLWVLGPHAQHKVTPGPIDVIHAQQGGPQEARALHPLVVQHAEQRLDFRGEMLHLHGQSGWQHCYRMPPAKGTWGPTALIPPMGPRDIHFCMPHPAPASFRCWKGQMIDSPMPTPRASPETHPGIPEVQYEILLSSYLQDHVSHLAPTPPQMGNSSSLTDQNQIPDLHRQLPFLFGGY